MSHYLNTSPSRLHGSKAAKLLATLTRVFEADLDDEMIDDVWFERISGPHMEAYGHAGGWYYQLSDGFVSFLGHSYEEARDRIRDIAFARRQLRKQLSVAV